MFKSRPDTVEVENGSKVEKGEEICEASFEYARETKRTVGNRNPNRRCRKVLAYLRLQSFGQRALSMQINQSRPRVLLLAYNLAAMLLILLIFNHVDGRPAQCLEKDSPEELLSYFMTFGDIPYNQNLKCPFMCEVFVNTLLTPIVEFTLKINYIVVSSLLKD